MGAIQDSLDSTLPVMGYTVTYAVGSVDMILSGMISHHKRKLWQA